MGGVFVIGAGSLLLGVLLMLVARWREPAFFRGAEPLHHPAAPPLAEHTVAAPRLEWETP